jgi:hypothetical protein
MAASAFDRGNRVSRTPILCVLARTFTGNGIAIPFILDTSEGEVESKRQLGQMHSRGQSEAFSDEANEEDGN